jgi:hypothetical protein
MADQDRHDEEQARQRLEGQFAELNSALTEVAGKGGLDPARVIRFAARAIPHTRHCGLTLLRKGKAPQTLEATGDLPLRVDALQYSLGEGPCLDAAEQGTICLTGAVDEDDRWPVFGPRCREETGVQSMLGVRLPLANEDQAALNFYSVERDAFDELDVSVASIFAPFASLAVEQQLREQDSEHFHAALTSSRQIGTAVGIIMARHLVTADEAFEMLRQASQQLNRKLRDIAADVEQTGLVPTVPGPGAGGARNGAGASGSRNGAAHGAAAQLGATPSEASGS